jgi:drug/metabolite transporter (DMT)-like permease
MLQPDHSGALSRSAILAYVSLCLIWGSTWMAIRVVVRDVPPLQAAGVRFLAAGAILLAWALAQKRQWPKGDQEWKAVMVLSLTIMAVPYGLLFWAEQYVTSGMTAVLFSASPLVVALLTPLLMKRKVPRDAVFAMLVAFGGLVALLWTGLSSGGARALLGGVAVLASVVMSAWSVVYAKRRLHDVDPVTGTGLQLLFGAVALLWGTWALESHRHAVWSRPALLATAFLTVFGSCAAFVIYYWLLKRMQPYQAATISLVVPIVAVLEGALLLREAVPLSMMVAIVVVLGSVGAVLRPHVEPQQDSVHVEKSLNIEEGM